MAVQAAVIDRSITSDGAAVGVTWANLANGDSGTPVQFAAFSDKTYQVIGTFGAGGTLVVEGSNDGVNWASITNRQGNPMSFTSASLNTSQDRTVWIRPRASAGDGTTLLSCMVAMHKSDISMPG